MKKNFLFENYLKLENISNNIENNKYLMNDESNFHDLINEIQDLCRIYPFNLQEIIDEIILIYNKINNNQKFKYNLIFYCLKSSPFLIRKLFINDFYQKNDIITITKEYKPKFIYKI